MQLKVTSRAHVKLFSEGLVAEDRELTCVEMVDSLQSAIDETITNNKPSRVAVIPEGPYVVPRLAA